MSGGYLYILANRRNGALYTGAAADIATRVTQHKAGEGSASCREYGIDTGLRRARRPHRGRHCA